MKSDFEVYEHYVKYCITVGHTAPTFVRWMSLRDEPVQFDTSQSQNVEASGG